MGQICVFFQISVAYKMCIRIWNILKRDRYFYLFIFSLFIAVYRKQAKRNEMGGCCFIRVRQAMTSLLSISRTMMSQGFDHVILLKVTMMLTSRVWKNEVLLNSTTHRPALFPPNCYSGPKFSINEIESHTRGHNPIYTLWFQMVHEYLLVPGPNTHPHTALPVSAQLSR